MYEIIKGAVPTAKKIVLYGVEGIGKTTFASKFPDPLFIDTEGGTKDFNVSRLPAPSSWKMLQSEISEVIQRPTICKTLIIDTVDWAEKLAYSHVCASKHWDSIEAPGYGAGYRYAFEEMGKMLNLLSEVVNKGIHVLLNAHAAMRKFEQPDEMGSYDRWELKLQTSAKCNTASMVKEWADMVLFANYRTFAVAVDDKGKKFKAQGGERVMYTSHHPCWDAKNRYGLPEELPFSFDGIAHLFGDVPARPAEPETRVFVSGQPATMEDARAAMQQLVDTAPPPAGPQIPEELPAALRDLMQQNHVDEAEIRRVVAERGYFPEDMPVTGYPADFVQGVLISAWEQVFGMIMQRRNAMSAGDLPF